MIARARPARSGVGPARPWVALVAAGLLAPAPGTAGTLPTPGLPQDAVPAAPHVLVVVGLGGDRSHRERFHRRAVRLVDALRGRGLPPGNATYLGEEPATDPGRIDGASTREGLRAAIRDVASTAAPDAPVFLVLIGHGSFDGRGARFNLPGPDVTAEGLGGLLEGLAGRPVALVHTGSSSGAFLEPVAAPGRTIITATRSGRERNEPYFGEHFVAAFVGDDADADRDGRISLLEAFRYARRATDRTYEERNLLPTEHALLDGDGDGEGSPDPEPGSPDAAGAAGLYPAGTGMAVDGGDLPADPRLRALYDEKAALERKVAALRARKDELPAGEYESRLEALLVELALTSREIRRLEGGEP